MEALRRRKVEDAARGSRVVTRMGLVRLEAARVLAEAARVAVVPAAAGAARAEEVVVRRGSPPPKASTLVGRAAF